MIKLKKILLLDTFNLEGEKPEDIILFEEHYIIDGYTKLQDSYTPKKKDKIYIYPGCTIPRFKLSDLCKKYGISLTRDKDKASAKFCNKSIYENSTYYNWVYTVPRIDLINWMKSPTIMRNIFIPFIEKAEKIEDKYVYIEYNPQAEIEDNGGPECNLYKDFIFVKEDFIKYVENIFNDPLLYHEDCILNLLNTGTVMNEKLYKECKAMFNSDDIESHKMAMEVMANCDFQKSAVYLLLLYKDFGATSIHNSRVKHHVNFKSFKNYFKINKQSLSLDDIIECLRYQKLLNTANLNILMPMIMEQIREKGEMDHIKIKDLELTPELEASIAENVLDNQQSQEMPDSHTEIFAPSNEPDLGSI
jgi:hypothetical protein